MDLLNQLKRAQEREEEPEEWRPFQQFVLDVVNGPVDSRKIYWIVDETGNTGKTYLTKYLVMNKGAFIGGGKRADIFAGYDFEEIALFDFPREAEELKGIYGSIEKIKDWCFFSGKYQSSMRFKKGNPHVICFANFFPAMKGAFSLDRLVIIRLKEGGEIDAIGQESNEWGELRHMLDL